MEREELVKMLYDAAVDYAKDKGLDEAMVRFGGNITSWTFPVRVGLDELEKRKDEYCQDPNMLMIIYYDKNTEGSHMMLDCQVKTDDFEYNVAGSDIVLRYGRAVIGGYDDCAEIRYSDAKRVDLEKVEHTSEYVQVGGSFTGRDGENLFKGLKEYIQVQFERDEPEAER